RPGTALLCCALTNSSANWPSSTFHTGCQYTPVLSIATCVTPCSASQSANASGSAVVVGKVRICLVGSPGPALPGVSTHATTVCLWTSRPQPRSYSTSIADSSGRDGGGRGRPSSTSLLCVLPRHAGRNNRWCRGTPGSHSFAGSEHQATSDPLPADRSLRSSRGRPHSARRFSCPVTHRS